ncbi:hypothetical protein OIV19_08250 [Brucella sp. HL-2]|nr:hypothetical protein [Brucella sp. HL-2]MCV9907605.1 hypothetical protein [Brucella sp. HL-2]
MKFPGKRLIVEYKNRRSPKNANSLWGDINLKEIAREVESDLSVPENAEQTGFKETVTDPQTHTDHEAQISQPQNDEASTMLQADPVVEGRTSAEPILEEDLKPLSEIAKRNPVAQRKQVATKGNKAATAKTEHDSVEFANAETVPSANAQVLSSPGSASAVKQPKKATTAGVRSKKQSVDSNKVHLPAANRSPEKIHRTQQVAKVPVAELYALLLMQDAELNTLENENKRLRLLLVEHLRSENARLEQMILRADQVFDETDKSV